jgi:hypothetical protein
MALLYLLAGSRAGGVAPAAAGPNA